MRRRTAFVLALVLLSAVGVGFVAVAGDSGGSLTTNWISETSRPNQVNHHPVVGQRDDGAAYIVAPVSTVSPGTANCTLVMLNGNGTAHWRYSINDSACAIHGFGDPTFADYDGNGDLEVLVPTTETRLYAFDAKTGRVELRVPLASFGYSQPAVVAEPSRRTVVADFYGHVSAVRPDGTVAWRRNLSTVVVGDVVGGDFANGPAPELAIGGSKRLVLLEPNGTLVWSRNVSAQYLVSARVDGTSRLFAARGRTVTAVAGNGAVLWRVRPGDRPAIKAVADGDADGVPEVYVGVRGHVLALDARTGDVEWRTTLAPDTLVPAPAVGDVDGDGRPEVVAVTKEGQVSVLDAQSGAVLASYSREVPIWVRSTVTDYDGDGRAEILVLYGDGRVVSLTYRR